MDGGQVEQVRKEQFGNLCKTGKRGRLSHTYTHSVGLLPSFIIHSHPLLVSKDKILNKTGAKKMHRGQLDAGIPAFSHSWCASKGLCHSLVLGDETSMYLRAESERYTASVLKVFEDQQRDFQNSAAPKFSINFSPVAIGSQLDSQYICISSQTAIQSH